MSRLRPVYTGYGAPRVERVSDVAHGSVALNEF